MLNGLLQNWGEPGQDVFLNPPYSQYSLWVDKAIQEARRGVYVWALLNQSNAQYWQDVINQNMVFKVSLRGRVRFIKDGVVEPNPRYDNYLVHFGPNDHYLQQIVSNPQDFPLAGELILPPLKLGWMADARRVG